MGKMYGHVDEHELWHYFLSDKPRREWFFKPTQLRVNNDDERPVLCHGSQWVGDLWGLAAKVLNVWEFWVSSGPEMAAIHPRSVRYPHSLLYPPNEHSHGPMENICPEPNKCYFP